MPRPYTFAPGNSLLPAQLNGIQDDYEASIGFRTPIFRFVYTPSAAETAALHVANASGAVAISGSTYPLLAQHCFAFDPDDMNDPFNTTRHVRLGMRAHWELASGSGGSSFNTTIQLMFLKHSISGTDFHFTVQTTVGSTLAWTSADSSYSVKETTTDASAFTAGIYAVRATTVAGTGTQVPTLRGYVYEYAS